jgi:hypothetical protein
MKAGLDGGDGFLEWHIKRRSNRDHYFLKLQKAAKYLPEA